MLHIHRAERADALVEALGRLIAAPLADPFAPEVVAVPTRGVERWLAQRLSARLGAAPGREDGVAANVDFPFPGRLVGGAVASASGVDRETDAWLPERAVWPLLEVVDASLAEPWLSAFRAHLGQGADAAGPPRFSAVRHVADLFDRYAVHRPQMLRVWADALDEDGAGGALAPAGRWQAELWRRLRARIGRPSPAERLDRACAVLRADPALSTLPDRVSLFGLTRLPRSYLDVLAALAVARDVHLFLLHPSPALWQAVAASAGRVTGPVRRADDPTAGAPRHPLLATWGRDAREMQVVLAAADARPAHHHHALAVPAETLLARLQEDVRADRPPPGPPLPGAADLRAPLDPADRSLQIHACHGRGRQVEVVRDAILHLLDEDPTLEPRDVIVMCPDIEAFAPLVTAAFGAWGDAGGEDDGERPGPPGPDLRVRLADRSLRQTNPLLGVVSELIDLASARLTASQVLDLAAREPVRRRFRLDDDDLARIEEWVAATGVRWGLDREHRAPFQLDRLEANTWRAGVDRVLAGVAMADEGQRLLGGVLPLDDVDSGSIDLAGRLAELLDRLQAALDDLKEPRPVAGWAAAISAAADALAAAPERDAWQRAQLGRLLDDVVGEATVDGASSPAPLALAEVRAVLADRLRGRPTRASFRTGHLTVCTLVPMRSVPHRVVCLMGLDDGAFPRGAARDGDDLILAAPNVGDRDARGEDRQLLLDALLAATDHLVVTYAGRDERTNAVRPPAVPVGELLDVVDRTVRLEEPDRPARHRVVTHHPLQPFDRRNFAPGALVPGRPWSFDAVALEGARALDRDRRPAPPFLAGPLPAPAADVLALDDLVAFVQHPARAFLRQRLGIRLGQVEEEPDDALPVELDALEEWGVGQRLLDGRLAGAEAEACVAAEIARGILPPGGLADPILRRVRPVVERLVAEAASLPGAGGEPASAEVAIALPDGRRLVGAVPGVVGDVLRTVTYSRVGPRQRLAAWVRLVALAAAKPDRGWTAVTVGRRRRGGRGDHTVTVATAGPVGAGEARAILAALVDLHDRGMREALPLSCGTSAAYARAVGAGREPRGPAGREWTSEWTVPGEDADAEHQLVLGGRLPLEVLLAEAPRPDEGGTGWADDEPTRFGRYALRLWDGVLAHEKLADR